MRGPHNIWRLIRTGATMERAGAMTLVLDAMQAPRSTRIAARVLAWPFAWLGYRGDPDLPPPTRALTALGPAYIKFGQSLATRPDVVGVELANQLMVLQDQLPPFPTEVAKAIIEEETGRSIDELFTEFSEPIAAASIAQVHRARLRADGREVAVKVLRPGIERAFGRDIDAFYLAASMVETLSPGARRLRPLDVIEHFHSIVKGELDLRLEASSASEFAANTANDARFSVPAVEWSMSSRRMMTMEWVEGISAHDIQKIEAAGIDRVALAENILQMFLRHALRDGLFHGDLHQGNLKISPQGDLQVFDFGIMGRLDPYTRRVYAEILYGFIKRDYRRVAEVHFEAGYVPADQSVEEFARALRVVGEPIFGMDASRISMARLLSYLFEVTEQFGMQTRTELILLQRTMVVVEGVARSFDPQISIWKAAQPVVESYIKDSIGPRAMLRDLGSAARILTRFGPRLPAMVEAALVAQSKPVPPAKQGARIARTIWAVLAAGALMAVGFGLAQVF